MMIPSGISGENAKCTEHQEGPIGGKQSDHKLGGGKGAHTDDIV